MDVPLSAIYTKREQYEHYPAFQRDKVWPLSMKRELIDSILHGFYIPAILTAPRAGVGLWIVDGQQRLSTIYEFMEGGFRTGSWAEGGGRNEPGHEMRDPHRFYAELSPAMKEQFDNYLLRFIVLDEVEDQLLSRMYRRLQHQVPLTTSEKLWSYSSAFTHAAVEISAHPFFAEMYAGKKNRKQSFQIATYALIPTLSGTIVGLDADRLRYYCAGRKDELVCEEKIARLADTLDAIRHLFAGVQVSSMTEIIVLVQTVHLLQALHLSPFELEAGVLTSWYHEVQQENQHDRDRGFMNLFSQLPKVHFQRQFWQRHLLPVAATTRVLGPTRAEVARLADRIVAWLRTGGHCIQCKAAIPLDALTGHAVRPADYTDPTLAVRCAVPESTTVVTPAEEEAAPHTSTETEVVPSWEFLRDSPLREPVSSTGHPT